MEKKIEHMRKLMLDTALSKGLEAIETIEISRKLDALLNHYEKETGGSELEGKAHSFIDKKIERENENDGGVMSGFDKKI